MARDGGRRTQVVVALAIVLSLWIGASVGSVASGTSPKNGSVGPLPRNPSMLAVASSAAPSATNLVWSNLNIPDFASPPPRIDGSMVWDSTDGYGLLFGGQYLNTTTYHTVYYNDTWTYLTGRWTNVTPSRSPSARDGAGLADDPADHEVVLFGGYDAQHDFLNDTWTWSSGGWTNVTPKVSPPAGYWGSMAYDATTSSVLLFGGINGTSQYGNDTWSFRAGVWTQLTPTVLPTGRHGQEMVYDAADAEMVMFGGLGPTVYLNDTWTYSAGNWAPIAPANHPGARVGPGLAYDTLAGKVVLYGGAPAPFDYYSTWLFSGGAWTQYNVTGSPPNPTNPWGQMIYDLKDNYVFLYYEIDGEGPNMQSWALTLSPGTAVTPLTATLTVSPSTVSVNQSTNFTTIASGGTPGYRYVYTGLPPGCTSLNSAIVPCVPKTAGSYTVRVTVTDLTGNSTNASTTLTVSTTGTSTPGNSSGWIWILVLVVVIVAALVLFVVWRRRRRPPPPAPSVPPPPPPPPP